MKNKILVLIPTYNEFENIGTLIREIERLRIPDLDILVVDDGSYDGTIDALKRLCLSYDNIFVLERGARKE